MAESLIGILHQVSLKTDWNSVMSALYCCDFHERDLPMESHYLIALFYDCLARFPKEGSSDIASNTPGVDENLVWSLTINLKGIPYESSYDPLIDPEVQSHVINR